MKKNLCLNVSAKSNKKESIKKINGIKRKKHLKLVLVVFWQFWSHLRYFFFHLLHFFQIKIICFAFFICVWHSGIKLWNVRISVGYFLDCFYFFGSGFEMGFTATGRCRRVLRARRYSRFSTTSK